MQAARIIKQVRLGAGLTQAELARRVGTTQSAIARLEAGSTEPSLARVDLLVSACGARLAVSIEGGDGGWGADHGPTAAQVQERWDSAVRMANFVLDGRRVVAAG